MINRVILIGRVGKAPEVRHFENDTSVAKFPLATMESYKNKSGEKVESAEWHNVVLWRGLAKIAEDYIEKGALIYLEGRIKTRSWEDKDGKKRYTTEILGDYITMLGGKQNSETEKQTDKKHENKDINDNEDDLPF